MRKKDKKDKAEREREKHNEKARETERDGLRNRQKTHVMRRRK